MRKTCTFLVLAALTFLVGACGTSSQGSNLRDVHYPNLLGPTEKILRFIN